MTDLPKIPKEQLKEQFPDLTGLKLFTGDQLIGMVVGKTRKSLRFRDPLIYGIISSEKGVGQMAMRTYIPGLSSESPDNFIDIPSAVIMFLLPLSPETREIYLRAIGKIWAPEPTDQADVEPKRGRDKKLLRRVK